MLIPMLLSPALPGLLRGTGSRPSRLGRKSREMRSLLDALERLGVDPRHVRGWLGLLYGLGVMPPRELLEALERAALRTAPHAHLAAARVADDLAAAANRLEAVTTIADARREAASLRELAGRARRLIALPETCGRPDGTSP